MDISHEDILLPLALTVVIDRKVRAPELESFVRQAQGLIELFDLAPREDSEIREWFEENEAELREKLNGPRRNTLVLRALSAFKTDRDAEAIFDAMVSVSVSDREYVRSESDLVKSACAIWGFDRPPLKVDRDNG